MINRITLISFLFLMILIIGIQYFFLQEVLRYGLTPDDWGLLYFYKSLGDNPLSKIPYVWSVKGAYTTSQVYFIGILHNFFGLNYQLYQLTNIFFKILAAISLYPVILLIFKRQSLAFLTTLLYSFSYFGTRSLEYVVKGTDYFAITFMNFFLAVYFFVMTKKVEGWKWKLLMGLFWFLSLMVSPIRMYPILFIVPLIEIFVWLQHRGIKALYISLKRLTILYLPFLIVSLYKPSSVFIFLQNPKSIYKAILDGNWHIILTPFQGVGLTILSQSYWGKIFGSINIENFHNYLLFLSGGPLIIFGSLTIMIALVRVRKKVKFILKTFLSSTLLYTIFYLIAIHERSIPESIKLHFDPTRMYAVLIAGYILSLSFSVFLEWNNSEKKDNLLLALWISPPIIFIYTFLIWLLAPFGIGFEGQQGYYLVVPAIVSSLFISTLVMIMFDITLKGKRKILKFLIWSGLLTILLTLFFINKNDIFYFYNSTGINGRYAKDQEEMYKKFQDNLGPNFRYEDNYLFYFDVSEDGAKGTFYTESLLLNLVNRIHFESKSRKVGCIGVYYGPLSDLEKMITQNRVKGFSYPTQCGEVFFLPENFYAFKLKDKEVINIKQGVLDKLGF